MFFYVILFQFHLKMFELISMLLMHLEMYPEVGWMDSLYGI